MIDAWIITSLFFIIGGVIIAAVLFLERHW